MSYENWKRLSARQKACWPASDKVYLDPQHKVSVSLDAELTRWLVDNVVGGSSYTNDLEETIITALRKLRREVEDARSRLPAHAMSDRNAAGASSKA